MVEPYHRSQSYGSREREGVGDDVVLGDQDVAGGIAEGDERVGCGETPHRTGEPAVDERGEHGLAHAAGASGLVDHQHAADTFKREFNAEEGGSSNDYL